jgi:hypothetical protein
MATFQRRYSTAQSAAIIAAQLDLGWSAQRAAEAAAAGELPDPGKPGEYVAPFTMPASTARDKAGDERRARKTREVAKGGASAELAAICGELLVAAGKEAARIRRAQAAGKVDPDRIARAARATREVAQLVAQLDRAPREGAGKPAPAPEQDKDGGGWLAEVAERAA